MTEEMTKHIIDTIDARIGERDAEIARLRAANAELLAFVREVESEVEHTHIHGSQCLVCRANRLVAKHGGGA